MISVRKALKIEKILEAVGEVDSVIDIGCNRGYMARAFLDSGQAKECYGLELDADMVDPELLEHPSFTLYEGDLSTFKFPRKYDVGIYTAVHHHMISEHGRRIAMNAWRRIIRACNRTIILETGMLTEQGKDWAKVLAEHYSDDEDQLKKMLSSVGKRLDSVEVIMEIPMRGTIRPIYKIELKNG